MKNLFPYYLLVYFYLFFVLLLTEEIIWLSAKLIRATLNPHWLQNCFNFFEIHNITSLKICFSTAFFVFLLSLYSLYEGTKTPQLEEVKIYSSKISKPQKIVLLSDLHLSELISERKIKEIVEKSNSVEADVIVLAGDTIDDNPEKIKPLINSLRKLKAKKGVYFVLGNHENYFYRKEKDINALESCGFIFLNNSGFTVNDQIYIGGIPDIFSYRVSGEKVNLQKTFANCKDEKFRILLSHTPYDFKEENNFDLELSGHTHGGQIFPFHLIVKLYNNFLSGLYSITNNAQLYISRGAGQWGLQMRLLAPSEISVINLIPEKK